MSIFIPQRQIGFLLSCYHVQKGKNQIKQMELAMGRNTNSLTGLKKKKNLHYIIEVESRIISEEQYT